MANDDFTIPVRMKASHYRGQHVAGQLGRIYWCNPATGALHYIRLGTPQPTAGVHPTDAARFSQFPGYVVGQPKVAPPPPKPKAVKPKATKKPKKPKAPPKPPAAKPVVEVPVPPEAEVVSPDKEGVASPEDAEVPSLEAPDSPEAGGLSASSLADQLPVDAAEWTIKEWIAHAAELGVPMSDDDVDLRPKAVLVARIRELALTVTQ